MRDREREREEERKWLGDEGWRGRKGGYNDFLGTCRSELSSCRHGVLLFHAGITLDSDGNYNCKSCFLLHNGVRLCVSVCVGEKVLSSYVGVEARLLAQPSSSSPPYMSHTSPFPDLSSVEERKQSTLSYLYFTWVGYFYWMLLYIAYILYI